MEWNGLSRGAAGDPFSMNEFSTQEAGEIGDARALGMGGKGHRMTPETRKAGKLVRLSGDAEARCARRSEMPSPVAISCGPLPVWATADRNPPMRGACACWRLCRSRPVRRVSIEASTEGTSWSTQRSMQPGSNTKTGWRKKRAATCGSPARPRGGSVWAMARELLPGDVDAGRFSNSFRANK